MDSIVEVTGSRGKNSTTIRGIMFNEKSELRDIIATLYDVMHRQNFHDKGQDRQQIIDDFIHDYSEVSKRYPEDLTNYQMKILNYDQEKSLFTEFIDFLQDMSIQDESSVNHWLVPPMFPANGCDNPKIVDIAMQFWKGAITIIPVIHV